MYLSFDYDGEIKRAVWLDYAYVQITCNTRLTLLHGVIKLSYICVLCYFVIVIATPYYIWYRARKSTAQRFPMYDYGRWVLIASPSPFCFYIGRLVLLYKDYIELRHWRHSTPTARLFFLSDTRDNDFQIHCSSHVATPNLILLLWIFNSFLTF